MLKASIIASIIASMNTIKLLPCPFCGAEMDDDEDVVYPTGDVWYPNKATGRLAWGKLRDFQPSELPPKEQWMYGVYCQKHNGGCGANMEGGNKQQVIEKWNTRNT